MRCNITTFPWHGSWHLSHKLATWESKSLPWGKWIYHEGRSWPLKESFKTPLISCPIINPTQLHQSRFSSVQTILKSAGSHTENCQCFNSKSSNVMNMIRDKTDKFGLKIMRKYLQYSLSALQFLHIQSALSSTFPTGLETGLETLQSLLFFLN